MSFSGDDMVIKVRLKDERTAQRERAAEERREHQEAKKRRRAKRRLRRAKMVRGSRRGKTVRGSRRGRSKLKAQLKALKTGVSGIRYAARGARKLAYAIPVLGWVLLAVDVALIANDAALLAHEGGRRIFGGMSSRLIQLQDNAVTMGDIIPRAAANAAALEYVEGDASLLRAIGEDNKMTGTLRSNLVIIRRLAYERAVGANMIRSDSHFDSADSFLDKIIMQAERADLKAMADRTIHLIRTERASKGKGK